MNTKLFKSDASQDGNEQPSKHVVIVGGGIAGLSTAWYLQQKAVEQGVNLEYTVLVHSNRWGGKIQTEQVEGFGDAPFILEAGPDAFLTRKPWALALARGLGLNERILSINQEKMQDQEHSISGSDLINEKFILVRKGKKNYFLIIVV